MPNSQNKVAPLTLGDLLTRGIAELKAADIGHPELEARLLIGHALKLDVMQFITRSENVLREEEIESTATLLNRRLQHEPVARILGEREFWSLPFGLSEATLEPRADSETLVEIALKNLSAAHHLRLLDLGTGTGCLLLALLHELPQATGLGIDIAPRAIAQAQHNAERLELSHRTQFQTGSWFDGIDETFDLILSNPPYIATGVIPSLMHEVRAHDPVAALDGGADGLAAYRYLIPRLPRFLKRRGLAVFEIGYDQSASVSALFEQAGATSISLHQDLSGQDRCIAARFD